MFKNWEQENQTVTLQTKRFQQAVHTTIVELFRLNEVNDTLRHSAERVEEGNWDSCGLDRLRHKEKQIGVVRQVPTNCKELDVETPDSIYRARTWTISLKQPKSGPGQPTLYRAQALPIRFEKCIVYYRGPNFVKRSPNGELCFIDNINPIDGVALDAPCHPEPFKFDDVWQRKCSNDTRSLEEIHIFKNDTHFTYCTDWLEYDEVKYRCPELPFIINIGNRTARTAGRTLATDHQQAEVIFSPDLKLNLVPRIEYQQLNRPHPRLACMVILNADKWWSKFKNAFSGFAGWFTTPVTSIWGVLKDCWEEVWTFFGSVAIVRFFWNSGKWTRVALLATPLPGGAYYYWKKRPKAIEDEDEREEDYPPAPADRRSRRRRSFRDLPRYY